MSSEKKFWPKLRSPFRSSLGIIQVSQPEAEAGRTSRSASRVSSVYLSDDSSAFVVVPEFDEPERTTPALPEESGHSSRRFRCLPREASSSSSSHNGVNSYFSGFNTGTGSSPCSPSSEAAGKSGSVCDVLAGAPSCHTHGTGQDYDLEQRLGSAYDYIRTMPSPVSPKVLLSSDPQMLRKQLGVPQHSVINYPIGCLPDLPNPHVSESHILSFKSKCAEETISYSPGPATPPNRHDDIVTDSLRFPLLSSREKLSLHINTGASTRHYPPTAFSQLPLQNTLAVTTGPASLDSAPPHQFVAAWSQCCAVTTQSPMGIHATRSPDPQSSQGKPSKLLKRRVGPHLVSPPVSPLSPTSQEASTSRGVWPRKPVTGSGPLPNGHERQESLPQLRTPSPFRVDLPIHHSWHDRRTTFDFSEGRYEIVASTSFPETKPRRTSSSTEALASLAWIGTSPLTPGPSIATLRHWPGGAASIPGHNQITMAIAVDDDSVSDDVLVDRLERIRRIGSLSEQKRDSSPSSSPVNPRSSRLGGQDNDLSRTSPLRLRHTESSNVLSSPLISHDPTLSSEDTAVWQAVRKALLCIREIVRTERKYQGALKMLLNSQTSAPPPPSMLPYVPGLIRASEMLLKGFLEDPSAWGVSTTFMTCEDELEAMMVSWCAVAGSFFTEGNDTQSGGLAGRWCLRMMSGSQTVVSSPSSPVAKQSSALPSPQLPSMLTLMNDASNRIKERQRIDEEYWRTGDNELTDLESQTTSPGSLRKQEFRKGQESNGQPPSRRFSVRDLAIQPTQRVMRYVLLYRDLLDCTPSTSPSRPLVERALEAATRIANKCDRAQRNPAFSRVQT